MTRRTVGWAVVVGCLLGAPSARAQSLYGQADLIVDRTTTTFGATKGFNRLFTQSYTVGYESVLWDRRFATYLAEVTFLRSSLDTSELEGTSSNFGYNVGASLFPNRPLSLSFNATRAAGHTSPQFPGVEFGASGVGLPSGFVPSRFETTLSSLDLTGQVNVGAWPSLQVSYRRETGSTAADAYKGTEENRALSASIEKNWRHVRNQLTYASYAGESRIVSPTDRNQDELSYSLSSNVSTKLLTFARVGYRDVSSSTTLSSTGDTSSPPGVTPPVLSNDVTSYFSSGGVTYQQSERLSVDGIAGYERLEFERRGRPASSSALYSTTTSRYVPVSGFNLTASATSALRTEDLGDGKTEATQRNVGAGVSYAPSWGVFRPTVGVGRTIGRTETLDGESGGIGTVSASAGLGDTLVRKLVAGASVEQTDATDDIFALGNYTRRRWQANAQADPRPRLRLDATWERTTLTQGLGDDQLNTDFTYGQGGAAWQLTRAQSLAARYGTWKTISGITEYRTNYSVASYRGQFTAVRLQAELVRDDVRSRTALGNGLNDRVMYRFQGMLEYRLRLLIFGFDVRYANNTQSGPSRYLSNEWRVRVGRRFGVGLRRS